MTDLVKTEPQGDLLSQNTPIAMLARATAVAGLLKDVLVKQGLVVKVSGKDHVKVEGWNIMGCMLGILSREKEVVEEDDGSFLATVELYNHQTGHIVGTGSALCGIDEARWGKADRFARRSMAITRATGKAYRLNFSWVMALSGYQVTPEEEMPDGPTNKPQKLYRGTPEQDAAIKKIFVAKKVPEELWEHIANELKGKDVAELDGLIQRARQ